MLRSGACGGGCVHFSAIAFLYLVEGIDNRACSIIYGGGNGKSKHTKDSRNLDHKMVDIYRSLALYHIMKMDLPNCPQEWKQQCSPISMLVFTSKFIPTYMGGGYLEL